MWLSPLFFAHHSESINSPFAHFYISNFSIKKLLSILFPWMQEYLSLDF